MLDHYKKISNTPALKLAVEAWHDLLANDLTLGDVMVAWDHEALVFSEASMPVAVLTFSHSEYNFSINTVLGWVHPAYRRRGIYTQMWDYLVDVAKERQAKVIMASTSLKNLTFQKVAESQGREIAGFYMRYEV